MLKKHSNKKTPRTSWKSLALTKGKQFLLLLTRHALCYSLAICIQITLN